ncbi:[Histone H3]-lysine-36 demethylase [Aspergillus undulatus]|uniref:[Histone H3]-lysine-36 demethylase n=1 Tax=Aspergillus undulatus TaxID=1810928 RepID=UPI003CCE4617
MISATSFVAPIGSRPPRYRTPSPPRRAVEPISPCSTADIRTSRIDCETSRPTASENGRFTPSDNGFSPVDARTSHRSGHGRSSSTIDTLATIALATSPTFTPLPYPHSSHKSDAALSLFSSETTEPIERPAKRPRSEKDQLYTPHRSNAAPFANPPSIYDSMKTDAELLLNFARPTSLHPPMHSSKLVSADEPYHSHVFHPQSQVKESNASSYWDRNYEGMVFDHSAVYNIPPSRLRSQSDGSAAISRPAIQGLRPNTSSSTLPPILWEGEANVRDRDWDLGSKAVAEDSKFDPHKPSEPSLIFPTAQSLKREHMNEPSGSSQSCANCHLDRTPVANEDQDDVTWIGCDGCKRWFHIVCAGFKNDREIRTVDKFICKTCRPVHGQTTFVRKSSRARTSIDYAGLNQGLVKSATDSLEHHYIEPIKQNRIRFLPESFPRMRPELVTAEYFERGNGMTEPIVIPAEFNRTAAVPIVGNEYDDLAQDVSTQEMFDEILDHLPSHGQETIVDCGQDQLDMVIPQGLTVRAVSELYGPEERVEVIDVKSQHGEDKRWTMQKWADYYESTGDKVVRNVISLEVSQSKLGRLIRRPKIVRDLDLQDAVWPEELKAVGNYPKVQFYCLMSVADCYTDFHIDFGGSSVYYHILKGKKTFFFIPPKDKHLKKYEEWCNSPAQDYTFLGDQTKECYRVDLSEGDTMLIPSGWIHAVWTPENSLVIGGNFLTRLNYGMQIKIAKIEKDTKVPMKFRYPFFQKIQWYTVLKYLEEDPVPQSVLDAFAQDENYRFHREYPIYYEFGHRINAEPSGSPYHNSRFYSQAELEGLPDLAKYLLRTALIAGSYLVEGITAETRNAVKRSIPTMPGEPIDTIRTFGIWTAWKRGNEKAAHWTRPGVVEKNAKLSLAEKKPAGRPSRRSERNAENQRTYAERQAVQRLSERPADDSQRESVFEDENAAPIPDNAPPAVVPLPVINEDTNPKHRTSTRGSGLGPKRVACDACRKRRIRCHHKEENNGGSGQQMVIGASSLGHHTPTAQDAASALNSLAAIASGAGLQNGHHGVKGMDRMDFSANYATSLVGTPHGAAVKASDTSPDGANSAKKGRSKACDDCRKSKRRCIHDEYGRIDPVKAQERSKPRANHVAKRTRNDEGPAANSTKRMKQESTSPVARPVHLNHREADNPTHVQVVVQNGLLEKPQRRSSTQHADMYLTEKDLLADQNLYASPPAFQADTVASKDMSAAAPKPATTLVSPPTSLADEMDINDHADGEGDTAMYTPSSGSRHSSRQPRHVERYMPEVHFVKTTKSTATNPQTARRSSFSAGFRKTTPGVPSSSKKSASRPSSSHSKKSLSPSMEKKSDRLPSQAKMAAGQGPKPEQANLLDGDTDAESLRLIRELQEQEFSLRRRAGRT